MASKVVVLKLTSCPDQLTANMPNFKAANYPDANSGYGDPWTPEGKERLYELRQQYKIPWQEFQEASCPSTALRFHVD